MDDDLIIEVTTESGERVAHGTVSVADVWGVSTPAHPQGSRKIDQRHAHWDLEGSHLEISLICEHCIKCWLIVTAGRWQPVQCRAAPCSGAQALAMPALLVICIQGTD